jgi:hypothetical protein
LTFFIRPKMRVKPLATRKYRAPSVMPLNRALRKICLRLKTSSKPAGHGAMMSHSRPTASSRMTKLQPG